MGMTGGYGGGGTDFGGGVESPTGDPLDVSISGAGGEETGGAGGGTGDPLDVSLGEL